MVSDNDARDIELHLKLLSGRDTQLWLLGLLVLLVMAAGVIALVLPNFFENLGTLRAEGRYLPQLLMGLIALVVLFNAYLLEQRRAVNIARQELLRQMLINERNQQAGMVDPLTGLFNRCYLEQVLPRETNRVQRHAAKLTLLLLDLDGFKQVNDRLGHQAGDELLVEVGQLLRRTFRISDVFIRYGGDEFLVILPDTDERQAQMAIERLLRDVERCNAETRRALPLSLSCGAAQYQQGEDVNETIRRADQRMYVHKGRRTKAQAAG